MNYIIGICIQNGVKLHFNYFSLMYMTTGVHNGIKGQHL